MDESWLDGLWRFRDRCRMVLKPSNLDDVRIELFLESIEDWTEEEWKSQAWEDSTQDEILTDFQDFCGALDGELANSRSL